MTRETHDRSGLAGPSRGPGVPAGFDVSEIVELDLEQPLPTLTATTHDRVTVLVRLCGQPVGMLCRPVSEMSEPATLADAITSELGPQLNRVLVGHGLKPRAVPPSGFPHDACPYLQELSAAAADGPPITVVIATLNGEDRLESCLENLFRCHYRSFEVLVVDNGSATNKPAEVCRAVAERLGRESDLRFITAAGWLSAVRNVGWRAARHDVIVNIDDDERADRWWLASIAREFMRDRHIGFVSGLILPAELDTPAQARFESSGGHSKGRGFSKVVFDERYLREVQSPMYPVPPFGAGGNMSFRREALTAIGGFDAALRTSEDTVVLSEILLAGWCGVYTPDAIVWHPHHRDDSQLEQKLRAYAVGLGIYYSALVWRNPRRVIELARLFPQAVRYARSPAAVEPGQEGGSAALERPSRDYAGIARGPFVYGRDRFELFRRNRGSRLRRSSATLYDDAVTGASGRRKLVSSRENLTNPPAADVSDAARRVTHAEEGAS